MQNALLSTRACFPRQWLPLPCPALRQQCRTISRNTGIARGLRASSRGRGTSDRAKSSRRGSEDGTVYESGRGRTESQRSTSTGGFGRGNDSPRSSARDSKRFPRLHHQVNDEWASSSLPSYDKPRDRTAGHNARGPSNSAQMKPGRSSRVWPDFGSKPTKRNGVDNFGPPSRAGKVFSDTSSRYQDRRNSPNGQVRGREGSFPVRSHGAGDSFGNRGATTRGARYAEEPSGRDRGYGRNFGSGKEFGDVELKNADAHQRRFPEELRDLEASPAKPPTRDEWKQSVLRQRSDQHNDEHASRYRRRDGAPARPRAVAREGYTQGGASSVMSIPYTTAASTFLYGRRSVLAALQANKRACYKLYVRDKGNSTGDSRKILDLAEKLNIPVQHLPIGSLDAFVYKVSRAANEIQNPIHDGVCLETSPAPQIPVEALGAPSEDDSAYGVTVAPQSKEDLEINGSPKSLVHSHQGWRRPFLLWLHGTVDMRNVGAIMRTAVYFGVDVILSQRGTAASGFHKTSAGASEFVNILQVSKPEDFIARSQAAGWKFYAAVAPATKVSGGGRPPIMLHDMPVSPISKDPCVLVLGNEDLGLPADFTKLTDHGVSIGGRSSTARVAGVDSLNVGIAAALLLERFCRKPTPSELATLHEAQEENIF